MSGLVFLLVAIAISVVGTVFLYLRHRHPTSTEHAVTEFQREMRALAPRHEQHDHDPQQPSPGP